MAVVAVGFDQRKDLLFPACIETRGRRWCGCRGESRGGLHPVTRARLRRWVRMALDCDAEITLRLVGRTEAIALNRAYRGRDYAPNVLTFAYAPIPGEPCRADIALCLPVLRDEARRQHKPLDHHLAHLVIHGVLHAQGHDHLEPAQADRMEALETRLLARLRMPDPYTLAQGAPD